MWSNAISPEASLRLDTCLSSSYQDANFCQKGLLQTWFQGWSYHPLLHEDTLAIANNVHLYPPMLLTGFHDDTRLALLNCHPSNWIQQLRHWRLASMIIPGSPLRTKICPLFDLLSAECGLPFAVLQ